MKSLFLIPRSPSFSRPAPAVPPLLVLERRMLGLRLRRLHRPLQPRKAPGPP